MYLYDNLFRYVTYCSASANFSAVTADACIITHVLWLYYVLLFWRRNKLILSYMNQNANYISLLPDIL